MHYTQEQIDRANAVSLEEFLRSQGEELTRSGQEYRWKKHDSLTVRGSKWFRHSQSKGGFPIDFVMEFFGKSFPEAVALLLNDTGYVPEKDEPQFRLPTRSSSSETICRYLSEKRKISPSLLDVFFKLGDIYEDAARRNVVFVGRDKEGIPRYAHTRGIEDNSRRDVFGSDKACGFSYSGTGNQLFVFEAPIDLLSFLCLYPQDWQARNYLSLGGVSGKALDRFLSERQGIEKIYLCTDNDEAGNSAALRLAQSMNDGIEVIRFSPAMKDWNDVLCHAECFPNRRYHADSFTIKEAASQNPVPMLRMSDIEQTDVEWLWKPYIPFGKVTIIQGNPGEGKTTFALRLAAACTTGTAIPKMEPLEPFNVIYQTAEDGLGDTVKPRLIEAGADLDRVLVIDEAGQELSLADERIEKAIMENNARLLILDPIQAYLGTGVDINRANEVRPVFRRLGDICSKTGCAIILIGHLNKAGGTQSAYRGLGSIDFRAAVRSVLLIGRVKNEPNIRVICHDKSSLAPEGTPIAFSLGDENGFAWIGDYDITADDLLLGKSGNTESKKEQAVSLILSVLNGNVNEVTDEELNKAGEEAGISGRTLRDGKAYLKEQGQLVSRRIGKNWYHSLQKPETETPDWTDPKQRIAKAAEILGVRFVDITDQVTI